MTVYRQIKTKDCYRMKYIQYAGSLQVSKVVKSFDTVVRALQPELVLL